MDELKEGDLVFHKTEPKMDWLIRAINGKMAQCVRRVDGREIIEEFPLVELSKKTGHIKSGGLRGSSPW